MELPSFASVSTIYILLSGERVESLNEYQKVQDRFTWVSREDILRKIFRLRPLTDLRKKSVIAIYEDGHLIKEFINVDMEFSPLHYC